MTLPNGYDSEIGERGVSLSGGQKQRIGIARALMMNPDILLLDDCTSALDAHTERKIIENLSKSRANLTTIFTTQRLPSLKPVHQVFVMKNGAIIESGQLNDLNTPGTFFHEIFNQTREKTA
jgi:ABC-type bacteriocin/lantibiotic exporter with double-glycine peptidase domain